MQKYGFTKGKYSNDFDGDYKGFRVSIHMGASTASHDGWQHHWEVTAEKK